MLRGNHLSRAWPLMSAQHRVTDKNGVNCVLHTSYFLTHQVQTPQECEVTVAVRRIEKVLTLCIFMHKIENLSLRGGTRKAL